MSKFIVLLRGINVGGNNILPMKELVALLEEVHCNNIKTYIQSGNVVLERNCKASQLAKSIEMIITRSKGFKVKILVLSLVDFQHALNENPYDTDDGKLLHLFFLSKLPSHPKISILEKYKSTSEYYELKGQVLYLYAPDGIGHSKLAPKIEKVMGVSTTARNWNTVQKLSTLASM